MKRLLSLLLLCLAMSLLLNAQAPDSSNTPPHDTPTPVSTNTPTVTYTMVPTDTPTAYPTEAPTPGVTPPPPPEAVPTPISATALLVLAGALGLVAFWKLK